MPSSPRWPQHTSHRSGARSAEEDPASGTSPNQGLPVCAPTHLQRLHPQNSIRQTGPWSWLGTTLALTGRALRELAIATGGPRHPGRAALAAVGAREVDAAARAASCRVLALVHVYRQRGDVWGWRLQLSLGPYPPVSPTSRPGPHPSPPDSDTGAALGCTPLGACRRSGSRRACSHTLRSGSWTRPSTRPRLEEKREWEQPAGNCAYLPAAFPRPREPTALTHALQQVRVVVEALLAIALIARLCIHALAFLADFRPEQYALVDVCGLINIGRPAASTCRAIEARQVQNM